MCPLFIEGGIITLWLMFISKVFFLRLVERHFTLCMLKLWTFWSFSLFFHRRDPQKRGSRDYGINDRGETNSGSEEPESYHDNEPASATTSEEPGTSKCDIRQYLPRYSTTPDSGFRVRREYRTLSKEERDKFHAAMNALYKVRTNLYLGIHMYM